MAMNEEITQTLNRAGAINNRASSTDGGPGSQDED